MLYIWLGTSYELWGVGVGREVKNETFKLDKLSV